MGYLLSFVVLVVGDQGVGGERQHLVKEIQCKQVAGKGHTDGGGKGYGEKAEIPGLTVLMEPAHVSDGIGRCYDPQ